MTDKFIFDVKTNSTNHGEIYINLDAKKDSVYFAISDGNMFDQDVTTIESKISVDQAKKIMLLLAETILQLPPE